MKIVLRQDVPKLGEAGSVQTVANGYGRNYLIPQGMAVVATPGELKTAAHNQAVKDRKIVKQDEQLQSLADKIDGQRLEFTARAGTGGRLYGSITAGDIAERLAGVVGEEIDRRRVVLDDSIRTMGEHRVTVHLVGRLRPEIRVVVQGEVDEDAAEPSAATAASDETTDEESEGMTDQQDDSGRTPGAAGHPEPGSRHDDSETVTVEAGPDSTPEPGVAGAHAGTYNRGGPITPVSQAGPAAEVADEMDNDA